MLKFIKKRYERFTIIHVYLNRLDNDMTKAGRGQEVTMASIEMIEKKGYNYIENIFIDVKYRHRGYLRPIIDYLQKSYRKLICLPLPQHVEKFKHLGFTFYEQKGDDIYYSLG